MRSKFWIYPWKGGYQQAIALAEGLKGSLIKRENSRYLYQPPDVVINWGSSVNPLGYAVPMLNRADRVGKGKRYAYDVFRNAGIQTVQYTTDPNVAAGWGRDAKVVGRDSDHGMGGAGITIFQPGEALGNHKFYCKYVKKEREFRIHVLKGKVIFRQEKLRKRDADNVDRYIRSHDRGWCFAFKHLPDLPVPALVDNAGLAAVVALGLDFGGVDIAWSERAGATVLEVNSAPGIEDSSLAAYVEAFRTL